MHLGKFPYPVLNLITFMISEFSITLNRLSEASGLCNSIPSGLLFYLSVHFYSESLTLRCGTVKEVVIWEGFWALM